MSTSDTSTWPEDLIEKYPLTFRLLRDFCCGEGWRGLLTDLCDLIEPIIAAMPDDDHRAAAIQVKEKFGGLRFYMYGSTPEIDAAISVAEARAEKTCERCGAPGVLSSDSPHGWVSVKCSTCRAARREAKRAECLERAASYRGTAEQLAAQGLEDDAARAREKADFWEQEAAALLSIANLG